MEHNAFGPFQWLSYYVIIKLITKTMYLITPYHKAQQFSKIFQLFFKKTLTFQKSVVSLQHQIIQEMIYKVKHGVQMLCVETQRNIVIEKGRFIFEHKNGVIVLATATEKTVYAHVPLKLVISDCVHVSGRELEGVYHHIPKLIHIEFMDYLKTRYNPNAVDFVYSQYFSKKFKQ